MATQRGRRRSSRRARFVPPSVVRKGHRRAGEYQHHRTHESREPPTAAQRLSAKASEQDPSAERSPGARPSPRAPGARAGTPPCRRVGTYTRNVDANQAGALDALDPVGFSAL